MVNAVALIAEMSPVEVVLLSVITQTGATPQVFKKVNVQAVTAPPPTVIVPSLSSPTTDPFGVVPQEEIVGGEPFVSECPDVEIPT